MTEQQDQQDRPKGLQVQYIHMRSEDYIHGGATIAYSYDDENRQIKASVGLCNDKDRYVKSLGRQLTDKRIAVCVAPQAETFDNPFTAFAYIASAIDNGKGFTIPYAVLEELAAYAVSDVIRPGAIATTVPMLSGSWVNATINEIVGSVIDNDIIAFPAINGIDAAEVLGEEEAEAAYLEEDESFDEGAVDDEGDDGPINRSAA